MQAFEKWWNSEETRNKKFIGVSRKAASYIWKAALAKVLVQYFNNSDPDIVDILDWIYSELDL